jgi:solute carrier family 10 (sodium/bile acid cotransporter), member 7
VKLRLDPYIIAMLATVAVASVLPASGRAARGFDVAVDVAIALLFFLYGARLSFAEVRAGLTNLRLQGLVLAFTFVAFPLFGLLLRPLAAWLMTPELATGVLFLTLMPSTVQSSVTFTAIAKGNVPAALCAASISNVLGVLISPLWVALAMGGRGGISLAAIGDIALRLLLPFAVGQLAQTHLRGWVDRRRKALALYDKATILLVVYAAFGEGVHAGIWSRVPASALAWLALLSGSLLALVLALSSAASHALGLSREDRIAVVFCGSKKSMASGLPMASVLVSPASLGLVVLPLMLFHQLQLMVCAGLAQRYAQEVEPTPRGSS